MIFACRYRQRLHRNSTETLKKGRKKSSIIDL